MTRIYPGHRTKDFLACNPHAVVNLGEQRRLQIEAGIVAVENLAAPVELRALLLAEGDIAKVLIKLAPQPASAVSAGVPSRAACGGSASAIRRSATRNPRPSGGLHDGNGGAKRDPSVKINNVVI